MKPLRKTILRLGVLVVSFCYISCNREIPQIGTTTTLTNAASIQVFSATVKAARNYIYVDGVPVSGAALAFGGVFPGTAYAFAVTAGSHAINIKDTALATTQLPLTFTQSFDAGKSYSIFTYDTTTTAKQLTITNNLTIPTDTSCMLRFANFVYNPTALPNVDVYSYRKGGVGGTASTAVFTNVATAAVTDFIPYASNITDTLYVYATGTTTPLISKQLVSSLVPTRSYTTVYAGSYKTTTTTNTTSAVKSINTFQTY